MHSLETLADEALALCEKLESFSSQSQGIERFVLTPAMQAAQAYLQAYFAKSLHTQVDRVGNVLFSPLQDSFPKKRLLMGSHLDSVRHAGKYDGVLGVVMGLLCAREYSNERVAVHTVAFADEEGGRFGSRFLGSLNFIGELPDAYLLAQDEQGFALQDALHDDKREDFSDFLADDVPTSFIELHSEQGLALHQADCSLGVVQCIGGQAVLSMTFRGRTAHAVSPCARQDALLSACELVSQAQKIFAESEDLRLTFGYMHNSPNQSNVVSDVTVVKADVRHIHDERREQAIERIIGLAEEIAGLHGTQVSVKIEAHPSTVMDEKLSSQLANVCNEQKIAYQSMVSYAGHDALVMTDKVPSALVFLRDDKGVSHHPDESVDRQAMIDAFCVLKAFSDK